MTRFLSFTQNPQLGPDNPKIVCNYKITHLYLFILPSEQDNRKSLGLVI